MKTKGCGLIQQINIVQVQNYCFQFLSRYIYGIKGRQALFARYSMMAAVQGFNELFAILSFDCDTEEDIEVVVPMHRRLVQMGIKPVYAVPGELLIEGKNEYLTILREGGEFINHGYFKHTYFDKIKKRHASCFFYDRLTVQTITEDILRGHETIINTLGIVPKGFRTPHFGTFQLKKQLSFLHKILKELNYDFSTSTVPYYAFRLGPAFITTGLLEIPVSGMYTHPLRILDSWSCFQAPKRKLNARNYYDEINRITTQFQKQNFNGLLNYYVDPSHIYNAPEFYKAVELLTKSCICTNYKELIQSIRPI